MKYCSVFLVAAALALTSCNTPSSDRQASIAPESYDAMTCEQLAAEAERVSAEVVAASGTGMKADKNPATAAFTFLFAAEIYLARKMKNDSPEIARLRTELDAIRQASAKKNCSALPAPPVAQ